MGKQQSKISQSPANVINEIEIEEKQGTNDIIVCIYIITVCVLAQTLYACFKVYNKQNKKKYIQRGVSMAQL